MKEIEKSTNTLKSMYKSSHQLVPIVAYYCFIRNIWIAADQLNVYFTSEHCKNSEIVFWSKKRYTTNIPNHVSFFLTIYIFGFAFRYAVNPLDDGQGTYDSFASAATISSAISAANPSASRTDAHTGAKSESNASAEDKSMDESTRAETQSGPK